jgi:hypothetical protein
LLDIGGCVFVLDLCRYERVVADYVSVGIGGDECAGGIAALVLACVST